MLVFQMMPYSQVNETSLSNKSVCFYFSVKYPLKNNFETIISLIFYLFRLIKLKSFIRKR